VMVTFVRPRVADRLILVVGQWPVGQRRPTDRARGPGPSRRCLGAAGYRAGRGRPVSQQGRAGIDRNDEVAYLAGASAGQGSGAAL
jgi:hypothetical protein